MPALQQNARRVHPAGVVFELASSELDAGLRYMDEPHGEIARGGMSLALGHFGSEV